MQMAKSQGQFDMVPEIPEILVVGLVIIFCSARMCVKHIYLDQGELTI